MSSTQNVVAALIIKNNKILIAQRSEKKYNGAWEFPGGKVEALESPKEALKRELYEELAIKAEINGYFMDSILKIGPENTLTLSAFFVSSQDTPIALEHRDIKWVPITQLLEYPLLPADIPIAAKLIKTKKPTLD